MTRTDLIKRAIESARCRLYKARARESYSIEHQKKAENQTEIMDITIEALEKQIPKKVQIKRWTPARCPSCGVELSESCGDGYYRHPTFLEVCPNVECCQRLDWSEVE